MGVKLRTKKLSHGRESIYLDIYYKGKRTYEFLDLKFKKNDPNKKQIKELAEKIRAKKELELGFEAYDIPNNNNGKEDFLAYFFEMGKDKKYHSYYIKFEKYVSEVLKKKQLPFNQVDEKLCEDYKKWLLSHVSNNTAWTYMIKLKTILNKAVREKKIHSNPAKYIKIRNEGSERVYLTFEEVKALSETKFKIKDIKEAFLFSCYTGLRLSDIKNLTWDQIQDNRLFFRQQKTRNVEYLPLGENALAILEEMKNKKRDEEENRIFTLLVNSDTIGVNLRKWAKMADINKHITFHSARHTFATMSLTFGVDLYTVSKLLGHKSISMTEIYAKIINKKLDEAVNMIPKI